MMINEIARDWDEMWPSLATRRMSIAVDILKTVARSPILMRVGVIGDEREPWALCIKQTGSL